MSRFIEVIRGRSAADELLLVNIDYVVRIEDAGDEGSVIILAFGGEIDRIDVFESYEMLAEELGHRDE